MHPAGFRWVAIDRCTILGSSRSGIALDRCEGRITQTTVRDAHDAGIRAVESTGLAITDNIVQDCGNGGILDHHATLVLGGRRP